MVGAISYGHHAHERRCAKEVPTRYFFLEDFSFLGGFSGTGALITCAAAIMNQGEGLGVRG